MEKFTTSLANDSQVYEFECFDNTVPIEIGDSYIFFFAGIADVLICISENEKFEINRNDRVKDFSIIDLVTDFWKRCYKIKTTNFDLTTLN